MRNFPSIHCQQKEKGGIHFFQVIACAMHFQINFVFYLFQVILCDDELITCDNELNAHGVEFVGTESIYEEIVSYEHIQVSCIDELVETTTCDKQNLVCIS